MAPNNTMQPTTESVTPFAFAKAAPLSFAADRERQLLVRPEMNPADVVTAFIAAMNKWEAETFVASRQARGTEAPDSYLSEAKEAVENIFVRYCTARERKYGRIAGLSFQRPPEYDPKSESVIATNIEDTDRAFVETTRNSLLGGGRYQYVLHRRDSVWLIDSLRCWEDGHWKQHIL